MNWFTSDWHLNETRFNLFYRPFKTWGENNVQIIKEFVDSGFKNGDTLYHLGDVIYSLEQESAVHALQYLKTLYPESKFILIIGNYDEDKLDTLENFFDEIVPEKWITIGERSVYLNHYPANCREHPLAITGHIHGLWKVQPNMINVGVDAWHFRPVPEETIEFCFEAIEKYYDENVFPLT